MSIGWILKGILIISAIGLLILSCMQSGKTEDIMTMFNGQSSLFANKKDAGTDIILVRLTYLCLFVFFVCVIAIGVI